MIVWAVDSVTRARGAGGGQEAHSQACFALSPTKGPRNGVKQVAHSRVSKQCRSMSVVHIVATYTRASLKSVLLLPSSRIAASSSFMCSPTICTPPQASPRRPDTAAPETREAAVL